MRHALVDSLRTIAFSSVFAFHFFQVVDLSAVSSGYQGVDVFFVISGFVLYGGLSSLHYSNRSIAQFVFRRLVRLMPALISVLVFTVISFFVLYPNQYDLTPHLRVAESSIVGMTNFYLSNKGEYWAISPNDDPLYHTWSLGVEVQSYLLLAFAFTYLALARTSVKIKLLLIMLSFSLTVLHQSLDPTEAFFNPFSRIWEFGVGILAAQIMKEGKFKLLREFLLIIRPALFAALGLVLFFDFFPSESDLGHPGFATLLSVVLSFFILASLRQPNIQESWILRRSASFGKQTYSMFLVHLPVLFFLSPYQSEEPWVLLAWSLGLTIILGHLNYRLFERRWSKPKLVYRISFIVSLFCLLILGLIASNSPSASESTPMNKVGANDQVEEIRIAIVGDSHATGIGAPLYEAAAEEGMKIRASLFSKPGCPLFSGVSRLSREDNSDSSNGCSDEFQVQRLDDIDDFDPDISIVVGRYPVFLNQERFTNSNGGEESGSLTDWFGVHSIPYEGTKAAKYASEGLQDGIRKLTAISDRVVFVMPIPEMGWDVPERFRFLSSLGISLNKQISGKLIAYPEREYINRVEATIQALETLDGIGLEVLQSYSVSCSATNRICSGISEDGLLYRDSNHLSKIGNRKLAENIISKIK